MSTEKDRLIRFVAVLIQLTQDKTLTWSAKEPRQSIRRLYDYVDIVYIAQYNDKYISIYQIKEKIGPYQYALNSALSSAASRVTLGALGSSGTGFNDDKNWNWVAVLEMVNYNGDCLWTFPGVSGLDDLFEAVQYSASGVKDLIDSVLGKEDR